MKALFLIFHGFEEFNGISKKIRYQVKALKDCGLDVRTCYYETSEDGSRQWMIDDRILADLGKGLTAKIKKRISYTAIVNYIRQERIELVYIRSYHNASPATIRMVKQIKKNDAKVVMEIPTYPYDQEYIMPRMKMHLYIDKCFRHQLAKKLDYIITFSNEREIFGRRTIQISNGISFDAIPLKKNTITPANELHLIGVAEIHYWHGFDRVVNGLKQYYEHNPELKVYFHIVGKISGERERNEILPLIKEGQIKPYIIIHGTKYGEELDALFDQCNFAIGSLGRHRTNITHIKTLKNREYAARGIPFIYSEIDDDFDNLDYVLKAQPDDSAIDIHKIVDFYRSHTWNSEDIRNSIKHLAWNVQMQQIIDKVFINK